MTDELNKKQIKLCLSCKKGHTVLKKYSSIYWIQTNKKISRKNEILVNQIIEILENNNNEDSIEKLVQLRKSYKRNRDIKELLDNITYKLKEKGYVNIEELLSEYILTSKEKEHIEELAELLDIKGDIIEKYEILSQLSQSKNYEEKIETGNEEQIFCLANIYMLLTSVSMLYKSYYLPMQKDFQNFTVQIMNEKISYSKESFNNSKNYSEKQFEIQKRIFEQFCSTEFNSYKIYETTDCSSQMLLQDFREWKNDTNIQTLVEKAHSTFERIHQLPEEKENIIYCYLVHAPKKFRYCFGKVAYNQNMKESIIEMLSGNTLKKSTVQSYVNTDKPQNEQETIEKLSKILLVSPEVLQTGIGKIYGNWTEFLTEEFLQELQKFEKGKNFKKIKDIKESIIEFLKMEYSDFEAILKQFPEFFYEEEIDIFDNDYERFEALLNEKEFYTLLEVLENN